MSHRLCSSAGHIIAESSASNGSANRPISSLRFLGDSASPYLAPNRSCVPPHYQLSASDLSTATHYYWFQLNLNPAQRLQSATDKRALEHRELKYIKCAVRFTLCVSPAEHHSFTQLCFLQRALSSFCCLGFPLRGDPAVLRREIEEGVLRQRISYALQL